MSLARMTRQKKSVFLKVFLEINLPTFQAKVAASLRWPPRTTLNSTGLVVEGEGEAQQVVQTRLVGQVGPRSPS